MSSFLTSNTQMRRVRELIQGQATSDGAGVKLYRVFSPAQYRTLDPFLLLDEFSSADPNDYLAGFPEHPHRGFETVTYMLEGHMLHQDHLGNRGDLRPGDVQWMTAGRGIIHSEMPQQSQGRMHGFQLWLNLPAAEKMSPARYRDIRATDIPVITLGTQGKAKILAGTVKLAEGEFSGPITGISTDPLYLDLDLPAGTTFLQPITPGYSAFVYVYAGAIHIAGSAVERGQAAVLDEGDHVVIDGGMGGRLLLLAAKPIREPVVQYGPFVMNNQAQIRQALEDYHSGRFTASD
jgi:redox-sensitive bicupin YhaK (pirin superfamily)